MLWLIMNMTQLNTVPGGKPLRKHTLTGDVLFAVWLPSLHSIWRTSISLALSLSILTWITPHGSNVINATPHSISSVVHGNPCKLLEINVSCVHSFVADSFRPFLSMYRLVYPTPLDVCSFRLFSLCCVSLALKMARKKLCPATPKKKKSPPRRRTAGRGQPTRTPSNPPGQAVQPIHSSTAGTGSHHKDQKLNQWDPADMKAALIEFHFYEERRVRLKLPKLEKSKAQIARDHHLNPSTFGNRTLGRVAGFEHRSGGARTPKVLSAGKQPICFSTDTRTCIYACRSKKSNLDLSCMSLELIFFTGDEAQLALLIEDFQKCGFPLTQARVRTLAYQYAHTNGLKGFSEHIQMASKKWVKGFLSRHPRITVKKAKNLSIARAMGANPTIISTWFKKLKETLKSCGINSPSQVWSGDETGVQTVPKERKVLALKNMKAYQQVSAEQGETSTVLTFVNGEGNVVPPMIIHKGERVQENWVRKAPGDVRVAATSRGYITKAKFHEYGLRFVRYLKHQDLNDRPHMLIVDSHSSHLYNLPFYQVMKANNIHVFTIPPHTSHILQPLDSTPFAMFKRNWEVNLMRYNASHHGRSLNKVDFWDVFTPTFNSSMTPKNIMSGFKKTGISPFDPSAISIESLMPSQVTEKGDGEV